MCMFTLSIRAQLKYPFHSRYQPPVDSPYMCVLPYYVFCVYICIGIQLLINAFPSTVCEESLPTISLPCNATSSQDCLWALAQTQNTAPAPLLVHVPCGLHQHTAVVVGGTATAALAAGSVLLLTLVSTSVISCNYSHMIMASVPLINFVHCKLA